MYGRDHLRRAIRHYLERDDDLEEDPEGPVTINRSITAAFTLARASVAAARDMLDRALRLPPAEPGRPSPHHRHYEVVWSFLGALWELIDFCELEQEIAGLDISDPVWFFGRAVDQHLGGNPFEALAILGECSPPGASPDPWVEMLRAETLAAAGDHDRAVQAWETATRLDPLLVPAHLSAAGELEAVGRDREAQVHWLALVKAVARDDPLAAEARRHLARLRQRLALARAASSRAGAGYGRLPRWGPSWVPAWPGRARAAGGGCEAVDFPDPGKAAPADGRPPEAEGLVDPPIAATPAASSAAMPAAMSAATPAATPAAVFERPVRVPRGFLRTGKLDAVLGLSDSREPELRVAVVGGDPISEGLRRSRDAVYLGGGRLVAVGEAGRVELDREEPDLVVLASGISADQCAGLAERARAGRLRSRTGEVAFLYNGPEELGGDLEVIFDGLDLTVVADICPPVPVEDEFAEEPVTLEGETESGAAALTPTVEAVAARTKEGRGAPVRRRAVARGSLGLAPVLEWLDCGERRHSGRRPPVDLVSVLAEPQGVEAVAVRGGEVSGHTFGPEGAERSRLLEELWGELPRVLPPGDTALLMGRLFGESGLAPVPDGPEAFVAVSLASGVLSRTMVGLRQACAPEAGAGGLRSSHLVVGGSLISRLPTPEHALLAVVDGCQPAGVTRVLLDPYGITAALGEGLAAGRLRPDDPSWADGTASLLAGSCLCVAPLVQAVKWGKPGRKLILQVSVKGAWRDGERRWDLCRGELLWVPLPAGRRVELVVRPAPPYSAGRGRGVEWRGDFVAGGLGLLLDGRGRPLRLPADETGRDTLRAAWASQFVGQAAGACARS